MDGSVDAPAAGQSGVGRVDDGVDLDLGDIAQGDVDIGGGHATYLRVRFEDLPVLSSRSRRTLSTKPLSAGQEECPGAGQKPLSH